MQPLSNPRLVSPRWHPRYVALGLIAGALIVLSWVWPPFHALWATLDVNLFYLLNGTLEGNPSAQFFWAMANHRSFDLVPAAMLLGVYLHYMWPRRRAGFWEDAAIAFFILLLTFPAVEAVHILSADRDSPSLVLEPAYRLSELVPEIRAKDASGHSFPGDHAMVSLIVAICFWFFTGARRGLLALLIACFAVLPRLVAGAHWLTDVLVGALPSALIATSLALAMPLYAPVVRWLARQFGRFFGRAVSPLGWG